MFAAKEQFVDVVLQLGPFAGDRLTNTLMKNIDREKHQWGVRAKFLLFVLRLGSLELSPSLFKPLVVSGLQSVFLSVQESKCLHKLDVLTP